MSIESILTKLGLTDHEALEFITHYNREYFEKCSLSLSLSCNKEYEGDYTYANMRVEVTLNDSNGLSLFTNNELCSIPL